MGILKEQESKVNQPRENKIFIPIKLQIGVNPFLAGEINSINLMNQRRAAEDSKQEKKVS